jgi:formate dehydrogenase subunit gamma
MQSTGEGGQMTHEKFRRFSSWRIAEHWMLLLTFAVLVITGLSQKFYTIDISQWLIFHLGGIDRARLIHRGAGVIFSLITAVHMLTGIIGITLKNWPPSMFINKEDISDLIHNIRYYLGMEKSPAVCGRYNYRQKFEYWGVLLSGVLMMFTGLILWFPALITRFLPGEVIPAAKVLHTNQAFLMFLIIALWHIYNSIFSPEVFPMDTSMFTGYISRERMIHEHPVELESIERGPLERVAHEYLEAGTGS